MREPSRNKAEETRSGSETFPRREGNKLVQDRQLTPDEIKARREERELLKKAREFRKARGRGTK